MLNGQQSSTYTVCYVVVVVVVVVVTGDVEMDSRAALTVCVM